MSSANLSELVLLALAGLRPGADGKADRGARVAQTSAPIPVVERIVEALSGGMNRALDSLLEVLAELPLRSRPHPGCSSWRS